MGTLRGFAGAIVGTSSLLVEIIYVMGTPSHVDACLVNDLRRTVVPVNRGILPTIL